MDSAMGGKTNLSKVVAYVDPILLERLKQWADEEERSVSWMIGKLIQRALDDRDKEKQSEE